MAQNSKSNILKSVTDFSLVFASVAIVAITYITVSGLTPTSKESYASSGAQVLGENTANENIQVFPGDEENLPYLNGLSLTTGTSQSSNSTVKATFKELEATTYSFRIASVKNQSSVMQNIRITPEYSLPGNYVNITLTYSGLDQQIISTSGTIQPLDISVPANTIADITITVQPTVRLATETTLSLDFTKTR